MTGQCSDADRVRDLAAGDASALAWLFDTYRDQVYNLCFRLSGSWAAAEDLTAMAFLECWRAKDRYRVVNESALPWLLGVAHNVARNETRARRRHRSALSRMATSFTQAPDDAEDVIERVSAEQRVKPLIAALRALPVRERDAIELCVTGALSHGDAAVILGVPVGTVKSRISRGLERLRALATAEQCQEQ